MKRGIKNSARHHEYEIELINTTHCHCREGGKVSEKVLLFLADIGLYSFDKVRGPVG
jgi:hypothetical protein